jgi:hypothetical protein
LSRVRLERSCDSEALERYVARPSIGLLKTIVA